jgi:3-methyl-2-oxobutanoate hydroxymethyltransferase
MVTAYDFPTAKLVDEAGVDAVLVGDSLAMTVQGHDSTLPATLEHLLYHAELVGRAVTRALTIVDLPFPIAHRGPDRTLDAAARIVQQTRCQAVKIEGGVELADVVRRLVNAGIPVMGHVGLLPQSVLATGGYRVQRDRERILADARAVQEAGAFAVVLECVPTPIAADVTAALAIPTIGIGAGPECDGQVLVLHDLLGLTSGHVPRFVKQYLDLRTLIEDAVRRYTADVRGGRFPDASQSFAK